MHAERDKQKINYMKTKNLFNLITGSVFVMILLISCNGCRSGRVVNKAVPETSTKNVKKSDSSSGVTILDTTKQNSPSKSNVIQKSNIYPIFNEKRGITHLDEFTIDYRGIKRESKGQETKVYFPNGKILSNMKDAAIYKDIPKSAQLFYYSNEEEEYFKEVDVNKLSKTQRTNWLGKMKLHPDIKQEQLHYMIVYSYFIEPDETPGRVCLATYASIWAEFGVLAGRIALLDIYDYEGNQIKQIPMYEYGGETFALTKDQKYLLVKINGSHLGDNDFSCGKITPMINIYSFEDGNLYYQLKMPCIEYGGDSDFDFFYFGTSLFKWKIDIKNKMIYVIKYTLEIKNGLEKFTDQGILTKDGKLWKYQTYTFEQWNQMDLSIFEDNSNK